VNDAPSGTRSIIDCIEFNASFRELDAQRTSRSCASTVLC
jgi:hypothetical protein